MADDISIPGVTEADFLAKFRIAQGKPDATADDMYAMVMAPPQPADALPKNEGNAPAIGSAGRYATQDHVHPRLTSATYVKLDVNSVTSVPFTRSFSSKPAVVLVEDATDNPTATPAIVRVRSWIMDGAQFTGCVIQGYRSQPLPTLAPLSATALLGAVTGGVNAIVGALTGYNVFGASAAGASISVVALARSDV